MSTAVIASTLTAHSAPAARPVFVIGSPRSGTSVTTWCLGQHPNLMPLEEGDWLCKLVVNLPSTFDLGTARGERSQLSSMGISSEAFHRSFGNAIDELVLSHREVFERLRAERGSEEESDTAGAYRISRSPDEPKQRLVDGTPEYSHHIYGLRLLFPDAKFIHLVRDGHSVALSLVNFHTIGGRVWTWDDAYAKWMTHVRACVDAEVAFGSDVVLRARHQDLMERPEWLLRRCLDFAGEEYVSDCLRPLERKINSSRSQGPGEGREGRGVRSELIEEVDALSSSVLAEEAPAYPPNPKRMAVLERKFRDRAHNLEKMYAENAESLKPPAEAAGPKDGGTGP